MFSTENLAKMRIPVHKAEGITPTERYLNSLCENTFLSLWSYPGIYRKQKQKSDGDGKELCDMLIIFDQHILIFSDKHCAFPTSGDIEVDWKRWFKAAIKKSADQAWGAERWLKSFPKEIYLDRKCTKPFPLDIPLSNNANYHLIIIAHGSEERCKEMFGGSGSLMFISSQGDKQDSLYFSSNPFTIGDLDRKKTFIHVLTESTLEILLKTLDTINDFVGYLDKKEKFCRNMKSVIVPGEEELLAYYLSHVNNDNEHDFVLDDDYNAFCMEEGFWEDFCKSDQRRNQLIQNEISYAWDNLIERFSFHALTATQYFTNHIDLSETEIGLRFMARESRTRRRQIMKSIFDIFTNTPKGKQRIKCILPNSLGDPYYVFLCLPNPNYGNYDEYRVARGNLLEAYMMVMKYKYPDALDIIGIASEPYESGYSSSEDLIYLDGRIWSEELNNEAKELHNELGLLKTTKKSSFSEHEYPE